MRSPHIPTRTANLLAAHASLPLGPPSPSPRTHTTLKPLPCFPAMGPDNKCGRSKDDRRAVYLDSVLRPACRLLGEVSDDELSAFYGKVARRKKEKKTGVARTDLPVLAPASVERVMLAGEKNRWRNRSTEKGGSPEGKSLGGR